MGEEEGEGPSDGGGGGGVLPGGDEALQEGGKERSTEGSRVSGETMTLLGGAERIKGGGREGRREGREKTHFDAEPRAVGEADTPGAIPRPVRPLDGTDETGAVGDGARDLRGMRKGGREGGMEGEKEGGRGVRSYILSLCSLSFLPFRPPSLPPSCSPALLLAPPPCFDGWETAF